MLDKIIWIEFHVFIVWYCVVLRLKFGLKSFYYPGNPTCECSGAVYIVWLFVFSVSGLIFAIIFSSSRSSEFKLEFIVDSDWSESFGSSSDDCSSTTGSTTGCGVGVFLLLFVGCGFDCNFFGDGLGETNFRDLARGFRAVALLDGSFLVILLVRVRFAIGDCNVDLPCDSAVTT